MKRCHVESLVSTVITAWGEGKLDWQITNLFKRIEKVLYLINEGEGGNDLVESNRGEKNRDLKFDLILNQTNIAKSQEDIVVTAYIEGHIIDVRVENYDKEMIKFDEVVVCLLTLYFVNLLFRNVCPTYLSFLGLYSPLGFR